VPWDRPASTGEALGALVEAFNPDTPLDRDLMTAALMTPGWGGPPGARPGIFFASDYGRGTGKSATMEAIAMIWGGAVTLTPAAQQDWGQVRSRLLSDDAVGCRLVCMDNVKGRLAASELETLLTSQRIDGHKMYQGQASRPNTFTYLFTSNQPSLSRDISDRAVVIKIGRAQHSQEYVSWATRFVAERRPRLLADIFARLEGPDRCVIDRENLDRWQSWQLGILAKFETGNDMAALIRGRRTPVDADLEDAEDVYDAIEADLVERGHRPEEDRIRIPRGDMVEILIRRGVMQKGTGKRIVMSHLRNLLGTGPLTCLSNDPERNRGGRCWLWSGTQLVASHPKVMLLPHPLHSQGIQYRPQDD
jgi:hypothetical protein